METAPRANRPRRIWRRQTLNFTSSILQQPLSNRNNASFKVSANSLKTNAKQNSYRNMNSRLAHVFTSGGASATNDKSQLTNHSNSRYNQASICAPPQSNRRTSRAIIKAPKGKVA